MNYQYHSGYRLQKGKGLGSMFSGLFRSLKPLATMGLAVGKKFLSSDLVKNIASGATSFAKDAAKNVIVDVLAGKSLGESAGEQLTKAKDLISQTLRGEETSKKDTVTKKARKRKVKVKDIQYPGRKIKRYNLLEDDDE